MNVQNLVESSPQLARSIRNVATPVLSLVTRLVIGYAFVVAGWGKFHHFDQTTRFFDGLGIPAPAFHAGFIAGLEVTGGLALMIGVATTVFALLLSSTMVVALATAHANDIAEALTVGGQGSLTEITAFVYLLFLAWLIVTGPGMFSIDRVFGRQLFERFFPSLVESAGRLAERGHLASPAGASN